MNPIDELIHQIKLASQGQVGDYRPFIYGHIANYDPSLHRIRCIVPSLRTDAGIPIITPWMPLASHMVGNGWGIQFIPFGGATFENPTKGEQVQIHIIERSNGVSFSASLSFNETMMPPIPDGSPGDIILKGPGGNHVYLQAGGGTVLNSTSEISAGNVANAVVRLLREEAALSIYNNHTHGSGPTPTQQMTSAHLTTILKAN